MENLWYEEQPDGSLKCHANIEFDIVDFDDGILDKTWLLSEVTRWASEGPGITVMFNPAITVGENVSVEARETDVVVSFTVDRQGRNDPYVESIKEGFLKSVGIGIRDSQTVADPVATRGRIVGGRLDQVSLRNHTSPIGV